MMNSLIFSCDLNSKLQIKFLKLVRDKLMRKYMLILFSYAGLKEMNKYLKDKLKEDDKLLVRAVMLEGVPKLFDHLISDVGFLGKKVVSDVEDSVVDIYQDNAKNYLDELTELAAEKNFEINKKLIKNHKFDGLKEEIKETDLDGIIINFSHNEFVSDQVEEENIRSWLKKLKLSQDIFYDGKKRK
jgi:bacterioferritin